VIFETKAGERPHVRIGLTPSPTGATVALSLRVKHVSIPVAPALCTGPRGARTTTLTTYLSVTGKARGSISNVVVATRSWRCLTVNKRPAAALRLPSPSSLLRLPAAAGARQSGVPGSTAVLYR